LKVILLFVVSHFEIIAMNGYLKKLLRRTLREIG